MEFKDITILKSYLFSWRIDEKPSSETKQFLINLIHDEYFQSEVIRIRKKFKFPQVGYDLWKMVKTIKYKEELGEGTVITYAKLTPQTQYVKPMLIINKMVKDLNNISNHYNLPETFPMNFFFLISYNAFPSFNSSKVWGVSFAWNKRMILDKARRSDVEFGALIIESKISKNELINFINKHWFMIKDSMDKHYPKFPVSGIRSKNIEISDQIYNLHKAGKSIKQILDILEKIYPLDDRITEQWISLNIRRFSNKLNIFPRSS
jgi:hypothetical protein